MGPFCSCPACPTCQICRTCPTCPTCRTCPTIPEKTCPTCQTCPIIPEKTCQTCPTITNDSCIKQGVCNDELCIGNYLGCYKDDSSRTLLGKAPTMLSAAACNKYAKDKGASYYGLQYGECWYSNSSISANDQYQKAISLGTVSTCEKRVDGYVGGAWSNALYKVV